MKVAAATRELTVGHGTVRIQRNGKFHSVVTILENYDGTWRKTHGMDVPMYKVQGGGLKSYTSPEAMAATGDVEKKNPDDTDFSDIWQLTQRLAAPDSPEKFAWIRANPAGPLLRRSPRVGADGTSFFYFNGAASSAHRLQPCSAAPGGEVTENGNNRTLARCHSAQRIFSLQVGC